MRAKLKSCLALLIVLITQLTIAQTRTVSGNVKDKDGLPLPGVNVVVKGQQAGSITDVDGNYSIAASTDQTLVFSFLGMRTQEVKATNTVLNVVLQDDSQQLEEVVVTALGIKREKKALGYAATTVNSEQLTRVANSNPLETLSGKVAGVDISIPASPGASPKVVVRGFSSITGTNQPLVVIDGTPMNNSQTGSSATSATRSFDAGSGLNDLDPNSIESTTFLKGAAASALYGSRAANGVIIITTKKGKNNAKLKVDYTTSADMNEVARTAHLQNEFGQGWNGLGYTGTDASNENGSWGPAFNGEVRPWGTVYNNSQQIKPYVAQKNNVRDFYDRTFMFNNSLTISGGNEKSDFALSYTSLNSDGIVPTNVDLYRKNSLAFNGGFKDDKFAARIAFNFVHKNQNVVNTGQGDDAGEGSTLQQDLMQIPRDINIVDLADYTNNPFNSPSYYFTPYATNPYFAINENSTNVQGNNVFGNVNLSYKILPNLTATWQVGGNLRNENLKSYGAIVDYLPDSPQAIAQANPVVGGVTEQSIRRSEFDTFLNLNYNTNILEDLRFDGTAGITYNQREVNSLLASVTILDVPNFYELNNSPNRPTIVQSNSLRKTAAAFLQTEFAYKERLFLTLSGRVDKTSTLPAGNNVYFYPAASASGIVYQQGSEYVKLRAGVASVASDTDPYFTENSAVTGNANAFFGNIISPVGGVVFYELNDRLGNDDLKPEKTTETEVGVESSLFNGRFTIDASVYYSKTKDLLVLQSVDPSTGYSAKMGNVCDLENKGVELALGLVPVRTEDFEWSLNYTFTKNLNEVQNVVGGNKTLLNSAYGINFYAEEGQPLGSFYAQTPVVNEAGQYVVNPATGYYEVTASENRIGTSQRDYVMGLQNTLRYKNLTLAVSFDYKKGGEMYSYTKRLNNFVGNGIETAYNDRAPFIIPNSVVDNGDGTYSENTTPISFDNVTNYWGNTTNNPGIEQTHLIDKTFVRMRDASLYYTFPSKLIERTGLTRLQVGIYGKNLFMWTPDDNPYVDPEVSTFGNDLASEFGEFGSNPAQRSYGAIVKLSF